MPDPASAVYEVEALTKRYPGQTVPANDAISLTVERGEVFGLLGANGAGKTTLVKQLTNLLAPTSGAIRLFGRPLDCHPLYAPGLIGYMPQSGSALNMVTVGETLYFTAHLRGQSRIGRARHARCADRAPGSGGLPRPGRAAPQRRPAAAGPAGDGPGGRPARPDPR